MWYTKAGKGGEGGKEDPEAQRRKELAEFRRRDEDMINAALGLAPARQAVVETTLDASEMKQLLARGASERGDMDAERVEGLGAAPAARHEHLPKGKSMVEREIERMRRAQTEGRAFEYEEDVSHLHEEEGDDGGKEGGGEGGRGRRVGEMKRRRRRRKRRGRRRRRRGRRWKGRSERRQRKRSAWKKRMRRQEGREVVAEDAPRGVEARATPAAAPAPRIASDKDR